MTIGERIRERRKALGYTQKQLGELCGGMADSAIRKYESGKISPKRQTLQKIASALEVSEWELVGSGGTSAVVDLDSIDKNIAEKLTASASCSVKDVPTLGEQLKSLRVKAGKTWEQLATELHTTKAAVSRYEKDRRQPRLEVLTEMAMLLDASPDELYCMYLAITEFDDEQGTRATRMSALSKWVETICGANYMITDAAEKHGISNEFVEGGLTTRENLDTEDSSFALYRADEDTVEQKLIEIFKKLDRDWQVALVDDAEVYLKIQEEKKAKIQKLKQDVE